MSQVGRNDPCPCGSGKKYKKCCWEKEQNKKHRFTATLLSKSANAVQQAFGNATNIGVTLGKPADLQALKERMNKKKEEDEKSSI